MVDRTGYHRRLVSGSTAGLRPTATRLVPVQPSSRTISSLSMVRTMPKSWQALFLEVEVDVEPVFFLDRWPGSKSPPGFERLADGTTR